MEQRDINAIIGKVGGNASANACNYKISIPSKWAQELGITKENKDMIAIFDGKQIILKKK